MAAADLLRVVAVEGVLVPDPRRRIPGRGAHVHPDPRCLDLAERRSAFRRAFRAAGPFDVGPVREFLRTAVRQVGLRTDAPAHIRATPEAGRDSDESSMSSSR